MLTVFTTVFITSPCWTVLAQRPSWWMIQCIFTASPLYCTLAQTIDAIPLRSPVIAGAPSVVTPHSLSHLSPIMSIASDTASKMSLVVVPFRLLRSIIQQLLSTPYKKNSCAVSVASALITCNGVKIKSTSFVWHLIFYISRQVFDSLCTCVSGHADVVDYIIM